MLALPLAGGPAAVKSGYCHQMLMECRTNRYNNPYMVLPAATAALQRWEEEKELWGSKTAALGESNCLKYSKLP